MLSEQKENKVKGGFNGLCNRKACNNDNAVFYNYSTKMYYCVSCARLINDMNRLDAMRLFGHELCIRVIKPLTI